MIRRASALHALCGLASDLAASDDSPPGAAAQLGTWFHEVIRSQLDSTYKLQTPSELGLVVDAAGQAQALEWLYQLMGVLKWDCPADAVFEQTVRLAEDGTPAGAEEAAVAVGHADVCWTEGDTAVVLDWKTGKHMPPHPSENLQLATYGVWWAGKTGLSKLKLGLYMARKSRFIWATFDSDGIDRMWERVHSAVSLGPGPVIGEHCMPCWQRRKSRCEFGVEYANARSHVSY